jgi:hypothetical protein
VHGTGFDIELVAEFGDPRRLAPTKGLKHLKNLDGRFHLNAPNIAWAEADRLQVAGIPAAIFLLSLKKTRCDRRDGLTEQIENDFHRLVPTIPSIAE